MEPVDYLEVAKAANVSGSGYPYHSPECVANATYVAALALIDIAQTLRLINECVAGRLES